MAKDRQTAHDAAPQGPGENKGVPGKGSRGRRATNPMAVLRRTLKHIFSYYPIPLIVLIVCVFVGAALSTLPSIFLQHALDVIARFWESGDWAAAQPEIQTIVLTLIGVYAVVLGAQILQAQVGAFLTQGVLMKLRNEMFDHMEDLPIRFFDQNKRGDIMSYYTNDVDALRQLIGMSLPNLLNTAISMVALVAIMLWYSIPMTIVVMLMVGFMGWLTKFMGGKSSRYFLAQQHSIGRAEGFAEEAMNGEKVIKVFTHERQMQEQFDEVND